MSNLNKVILMGRVGQDPEIRHTQANQMVANFSMATSEKWKDKQGQKQEKTEWHNIVVWGNLVATVENYVRKGKRILVEGKLQTNKWTDDQNVKHYKTEIVAYSIQIIDWPDDDQQQQGGQQTQQAQQQQPAQSQQAPEGAYDDDSIPF